MDGYSVTEAASILGVPTEKVWELIARGVLAGAQDGERGMRVFLQGRPQPPTIDAVRSTDAPPPREPDRELSPFRELLTEFRNLTERYGQALLALGEARGEVAALRSRVDLLEARMDLRLPPPPTAATAPLPEARRVTPIPGPPAAEVADAAPAGVVDERGVVDGTERQWSDARGDRAAREPLEQQGEVEIETASVAATVQVQPDVELPVDEEQLLVVQPESQAEAEPAPQAEREAEWQTELEREPRPEAESQTELGPEPQAQVEPQPEAELQTELERESQAQAEPPAHAEPPAEAESQTEPGTDADEARTRRRTLRWTTETFAEALARAEDPTEPELPGTAEAAAALAAAREEISAADAGLPPDTVAAESMEAVEEAWADVSVATAVEMGEVGAESAVRTPEPSAREPTLVEDPPTEAEPEPPPTPVDGAWDRERYTTVIEEPDWYAEIERPFEPMEAEPRERGGAASGVEAADEPMPQPSSEAAPPGAVAAEAWPEAEPTPRALDANVPETRQGPAAAAAADEEELLWFGARASGPSEGSRPRTEEPEWPPEDGAAEIEVVGSGRHGSTGSSLPGSPELQDALSALEALGREPRSASGSAEPEQERGAPRAPEPSPWRATPERLATPPAIRATTSTGPASRAYRRLRRIFPG